MTVNVKPSDIYRNLSPEIIGDFVASQGYRIVTFKMVESGDNVVFYNDGKLKIGRATVAWAGYPRFVVEPSVASNIEDFWE